MVDEFKIVIHVKGQTATIGISKPECDPVFFRTDGLLTVMLGSIPRFMQDAEQKWQTDPRYPKANQPAPAPVPTATAKAVTKPTGAVTEKSKVQTPMF